MAATSLNTWCITAAIIVGCLLVEIQPSEATREESRRNEPLSARGDSGGPSGRREALVEDLYEQYLADSRRNENTNAPGDPMITYVNNNPLEISLTNTVGKIWENAIPGSLVVNFVVYEPDSYEIGRISCELDDDRFSLVKLLGARFTIVNNEVFDRETQAQYTINVKCQENGTEPRTVTKQIQVMILDINDNSPAMTINTLYTNGEAKIRENAEPGTFVTYVSVYDRDSGDNARFECELDNDHFRLVTLHDAEYKIISTKVLDYEMQATYKLIIICRDKGWKPRSSRKALIVNVEDVNDNTPAITLPTNVNGVAKIKENSEPGTLVTYVSVYDADSGDNGRLNCKITDRHFRLVKLYDSEFTIVSTEYFKYGRSAQYKLDLRCEDSGEEPKSTTKFVVVNVEDVNKHAPNFHMYIFVAHITENNITDVPVLKVSAADQDTGDNGYLHYALDEAADGYFKVDPVSGLISTDAVLIHKDTPELNFHVIASDHGSPPKTGSAPVRVIIMDVNMGAPVFAEMSYHFSIPENVTVGTTIDHVQVANEDSSMVVYIYEQGTLRPISQMFALNTDTGDIVLRRPVNFEERSVFSMSVYAKKPGLPPAKAVVNIVIMDVNDNAPAVAVHTLSTSGEAEVRANREPGTFVAHISVSDADSGDNGRFTCALDDDHFQLVQLHDTGFKIITAAVIERNYTLNVKCEDNGESPLTTTRQVVVNLRSDSR